MNFLNKKLWLIFIIAAYAPLVSAMETESVNNIFQSAKGLKAVTQLATQTIPEMYAQWKQEKKPEPAYDDFALPHNPENKKLSASTEASKNPNTKNNTLTFLKSTPLKNGQSAQYPQFFPQGIHLDNRSTYSHLFLPKATNEPANQEINLETNLALANRSEDTVLQKEQEQKETQAAFEALRLPSTATLQQVLQAYRNASLIAHPDKSGPTEYMQTLNRAKDTLIEYFQQNKKITPTQATVLALPEITVATEQTNNIADNSTQQAEPAQSAQPLSLKPVSSTVEPEKPINFKPAATNEPTSQDINFKTNLALANRSEDTVLQKEQEQKETQAAFEALRLPSTATLQQVLQAYRNASLIAHPDKGGPTQYMQTLNNARDTLIEYFQQNKDTTSTQAPLLALPDITAVTEQPKNIDENPTQQTEPAQPVKPLSLNPISSTEISSTQTGFQRITNTDEANSIPTDWQEPDAETKQGFVAGVWQGMKNIFSTLRESYNNAKPKTEADRLQDSVENKVKEYENEKISVNGKLKKRGSFDSLRSVFGTAEEYTEKLKNTQNIYENEKKNAQNRFNNFREQKVVVLAKPTIASGNHENPRLWKVNIIDLSNIDQTLQDIVKQNYLDLPSDQDKKNPELLYEALIDEAKELKNNQKLNASPAEIVNELIQYINQTFDIMYKQPKIPLPKLKNLTAL